MENTPKTSTMTHALTPQQMLSMLRASPLFSELFPDEFRRVVGLIEVRRVPAGTTFIAERDDNADLYMLRRGRARAQRAPREDSRPIVRFHLPGDILNEVSFLNDFPAEWTVEAVDDVEVWTIPYQPFHALVQKTKDMDTRVNWNNRQLDTSPGSIITLVSEFDDQREGERVLWHGRRHRLLFFIEAWLAWLLLFAAMAAAVAAILPGMPELLASSAGTIARIALLVAGIVVAVWNYVDWRNDDYIVTDQRIIHRERILLLVDQQDECPLENIQDVKIHRPTFFSTLFDLGHLTIETQGVRGNVVFSWVRHPEQLSKLVLGNAGRMRERREAVEKANIEEMLREALQSGKEPAETTTAAPPAPEAAAMQVVRWLIPPMRETRGADIIYHKHWLLLLGTTGAPLLLLLLSLALHIVVPQLTIPLPAFVPPQLPQLLGLAVSLGLVGWLVWRYEDWRNDVYIVTRDRVINYDRSPFGLAGTQQITAGMAGVQNVSYQTRGLLDNLFNMGDVIIRTGGTDGEMIFARIWNPRRVQREIVDRLEMFQQQQQQSQKAARRREITAWLTAYDQIRKPS